MLALRLLNIASALSMQLQVMLAVGLSAVLIAIYSWYEGCRGELGAPESPLGGEQSTGGVLELCPNPAGK